MKKITLALALISSSVFANTTFNTVKVSDGKSAYCKSKVDLFRGKTGIYTGKAIGAQVDEQKINFQVKLQFLACVKQEGKYGFVYKKPYAEFLYKTISSKDTVSAQATEVKLKTYKDGVYKILSDQELPDEVKQVQDIEVALEDVLNEKQIEKLEEGQAVTGNFDFWVSKKMRFQIEAQDVSFNDLVNYGAFRINFKISNTTAGLKINLL